MTAELGVLLKLGEVYSKRPLNPAVAGDPSTLPALAQKEALLPVILQLHARHRDGAGDLNEYDLAYARAMEEMTEEERASLDGLADLVAAGPPEKLAQRFVLPNKGAGQAITRQDVVRALQVQSPKLAPALQQTARGPHILATKEPDEGFNPGDEVMLAGVGFGSRAEGVRVELWSSDPHAKVPDQVLKPTAVSPGLVRLLLPEGLKAGMWRANVVMGKLTSNQVSLAVGQARSRKGPAAPSVSSMAFSGKDRRYLNVQGMNFEPGEAVVARIHTEDPLVPQTVMLDATALSETAIQVDLESYLPDFRGDGLLELITPYNVIESHTLYDAGTPRYKIIFDTVQCKDESNPEWLGRFVPCHDEVVTFWLVQADEDFYTRNTGMYSGFDDNDMQSYDEDGPVLTPSGQWHPISHGIILNTQLYEWDEGDVHAAQGALSAAATAAKWILRFAWPGYGEAVGALGEAVASLAGTIIDCMWGDPDMLGESTEPFTAEVLDQICTKRAGEPGPAISLRTLDYNNSDRTGSYQLKYHILQDKPGTVE